MGVSVAQKVLLGNPCEGSSILQVWRGLWADLLPQTPQMTLHAFARHVITNHHKVTQNTDSLFSTSSRDRSQKSSSRQASSSRRLSPVLGQLLAAPGVPGTW